MDRAQVLRAFNDHFQEFIDDVLRVFPRDMELRTVARALSAIRKVNPRLILTAFHERLGVPYRAEIDAGAVDFFVDKNWNEDVIDSPSFELSKSVILDKIERMRTSVRDMGASDQLKALGYMQNLVRLTDLYAKSS
jgi:hypothetical protein